MASWKTERSFPGKTSQEIYQATRKLIDGLSDRYGLKHQADDAKLSGKVTRAGVDGHYQATGDKVAIALEFGFLIIGPIRTKVQEEVTKQLDKLFG